MCNPRRIRITATRLLNEAWQHEITRQIELSAQVSGEARVRQYLDASLGAPALECLVRILTAQNSGWEQVEEGYRISIEGGYILYLPAENAIEIAAVMCDEVSGKGEYSELLQGQLTKEVEVDGKGMYYSDGWGGRTKEKAQKDAESDLQKNLEAASKQGIEEAKNQAALQKKDEIEAMAKSRAEQALQQKALERQQELATQARLNLETFGVRARQVFNQYLVQAYRDALHQYYLQNGANNWQCREDGNMVNIEFSLSV